MTEHLKIDDIVPNPSQPRKEFDESELQVLLDSIKIIGVKQPITVQVQTQVKQAKEMQTLHVDIHLVRTN